MASTTAPVRRQASALLNTALRQPKVTATRTITTSTKPPRPSQQPRQPLSPQCLRLQTRRPFSTSPSRPAVTNPKANQRTGLFSLRSAALFIGTGAALVFYFQYEKARLERKRVVEMSKGYGKPKVGGPFTLQDLDGKEVTEKDLLGKYAIIYFGFTHCPDICPDELDKLSAAIDILNEKAPHTFKPIFISVDPARDTPAVLRSYLSEFHPQIQGLTGTWQQIKDTCKVYRVYFSTPQDLKPGEEDYLVDHSIYFYVMDPEGDFVECIGRQDTPESAAGIILEHIKDWNKEGKSIDRTPLGFRNEAVRQTVQKRSSEVGAGGVANRVSAPA
ncbi:Cu-binding protein [Knufia obscura]|uniref:Cu-binding protein n=2 Tax=Knufia TaxID=430999 RepID=A0AAN8EHB0_9EURO|nr:Cu-binding protein [Knufia obscura]KAK5954055.1 Cu-binding protein [Knufia fluminis]